jgi:hypothetical protein
MSKSSPRNWVQVSVRGVVCAFFMGERRTDREIELTEDGHAAKNRQQCFLSQNLALGNAIRSPSLTWGERFKFLLSKLIGIAPRFISERWK